MSVSGVSSNNLFAAYSPAAAQNKFQQIQQDSRQLGQDLQAGNLSQAQSDFSALQQLLPGQQSTASGTQSGSPSSNPISKAVAQLGQDLQAGNLSAAKSDFATLQQDLQQGGVSTHRFHHHHHGGPILEGQGGQNNPATLFGELGQELQSGNLSAAQQTYSTLQQDFLQFIGSNASSATSGAGASASTATSASLNVSA
jgi:outer membrane protein assembly factor BamD (BamD/ComL family)